MEKSVTDYSNLIKTYINLRKSRTHQDYILVLPEHKGKGAVLDDRERKYE